MVDNYAEGRVKVWWVDGHYSMCWPQDLFEVGQYDADHNFWLSGGDSDDANDESWETESQHSEPGERSPSAANAEATAAAARPQLAVNLERARVAMGHLEEILGQNPSLENQYIMRRLLEVYKKCRYMDRLMATTFFHENQFMGLIERVRRVSITSPAAATTTVARALDHKQRLFRTGAESPTKCSVPVAASSPTCTTAAEEQPPSFVLATHTQQPTVVIEEVLNTTGNSEFDASATPPPPPSLNEKGDFGNYPTKLFGFVVTNIENASKETEYMQRRRSDQSTGSSSLSKSNDSGNHSRTTTLEWMEPVSSCCLSSSEVTMNSSSSMSKPDYCSAAGEEPNMASSSSASSKCEEPSSTAEAALAPPQLVDELSTCVCARLCALMKAQLVKALKEINDRFSQANASEWEVLEIEDDSVGMSKEMQVNCLDAMAFRLAAVAAGDDDDSATENAASENVCSSRHQIDDAADDDEAITINNKEAVIPVVVAAVKPSLPLAAVAGGGSCVVLECAPPSHTYHLTLFQPTNAQQFYRAVRFDHKLLHTALPPGVWVRLVLLFYLALIHLAEYYLGEYIFLRYLFRRMLNWPMIFWPTINSPNVFFCRNVF